MYRLDLNDSVVYFVKNLKQIETAHARRISCVNTSVIVFYDVCPTLILAAILGEAFRFAMGVHICCIYS